MPLPTSSPPRRLAGAVFADLGAELPKTGRHDTIVLAWAAAGVRPE